MTKKLANTEIVTIAIYNLGRGLKGFSCEEIATEADRIAPNRFRWKTNPNMISDSVTWDALSNARKNKYIYEETSNYFLTPEGIKFSESNMKHLNLDQAKTRLKKEEIEYINNTKVRLINSDAYKKFKANENITAKDLNNFFRTNDYMPMKKKQEKMVRIKHLFINDEELLTIIDQLIKEAS